MGKDNGGKGGVVVNTASIAGLAPSACCPVYSATKYAVIGLTRCFGVSTAHRSVVFRTILQLVSRRFSQNCEKRPLPSSCLSVPLSAWIISAPTRILIKCDISDFYENLSRKFKFNLNPTKITSSLHEDALTFMTLSRWFLLTIRNVSNECCRPKKNIYFMLSCFFPKIFAFIK